MSPRIQRPRMRLLRFDFSISHVPGKHLSTTDALSRAPIVEETKENDPRSEEEINLYVHHIFNSLPASNTQLERIREKQAEDKVCQLKEYCGQGLPERPRVPDAPTGKSRMNFQSSTACFLRQTESSFRHP